MKVFIPVIFVLAISLLNCNSQNSQDNYSTVSNNSADTVRNLIKGFFNEYPFLDKNDWKLETYSSNDFSSDLRISRNENGIEYVADLRHVKKVVSEDEQDHFLISFYNQYYTDNKFCHYVQLENGMDTLYYYKKNRVDSLVFELDKMNFIVGKYQYLFDNQLMSLNQVKYFKLNQDSLRSVRGNDLPELPSL